MTQFVGVQHGGAERSKWVKPVLSRIETRKAENNFGSPENDGVISFS
jgi:hypothetical protein